MLAVISERLFVSFWMFCESSFSFRICCMHKLVRKSCTGIAVLPFPTLFCCFFFVYSTIIAVLFICYFFDGKFRIYFSLGPAVFAKHIFSYIPAYSRLRSFFTQNLKLKIMIVHKSLLYPINLIVINEYSPYMSYRFSTIHPNSFKQQQQAGANNARTKEIYPLLYPHPPTSMALSYCLERKAMNLFLLAEVTISSCI